jgi:hypothetical protein
VSTSSFDDLRTRLRAGDPVAVEETFTRYVRRLAVLVRVRLSAQLRQKIDPNGGRIWRAACVPPEGPRSTPFPSFQTPWSRRSWHLPLGAGSQRGLSTGRSFPGERLPGPRTRLRRLMLPRERPSGKIFLTELIDRRPAEGAG